MLSKLLKTFKYAFSVKGFHSVPESSFVARMGCAASDKFTIELTETEYSGGVSLAEFHAAFLCSPVFQTELWILSKFGQVDAESLKPSHLTNVAMGDRSCLGPWTAWAVDGKRTQAVSTTSGDDSTTKIKPACQIMRARFKGKPFCDTWWSVELQDASSTGGDALRHPQLVFGTAMIQSDDDSTMVRLITKVLDPLHRMYSRILLASAKANLVVEGQKRAR